MSIPPADSEIIRYISKYDDPLHLVRGCSVAKAESSESTKALDVVITKLTAFRDGQRSRNAMDLWLDDEKSRRCVASL